MSTALDIITGGFLNINSYSPGETLNIGDANVGLQVLNDLLDSLSNDEAFVFTQQETVFNWINGQYQYTVGNPVGGTFVGTVTGGSPIITGITSIPAQMIVGGTLTDLGGVIPNGTALFPVATTILAIGTTTVTMSANASATPSVNPDTITYTVPGNIPVARPLRFRSGFTRANSSGSASLDYTFTFTDFDNYKRELLKNVQGPWPYIATYQPNFPYGNIFVYPAPSSSYTGHIFSDIIISSFATTNTAFSLPQGYARALKKLLGMELAPIYGKSPSTELRLQAKEAYNLLKGTNATPVPVMEFDSSLSRAQANDAGWIIHGGFS
jgi:hypothetical protein